MVNTKIDKTSLEHFKFFIPSPYNASNPGEDSGKF